jgi:hypothetical protein
LETELAKEAAYRNHSQLERDKINAFWEISKRALERSESIAREYERRIDDVEDEADVRVRAKVQQIKHEQKENEGKVDLSRAESTEAIREAKSTFEKRVEEMREKIRKEERKIAEREVKCQEMVRKSEIERMKEITKLRVEFEEKREKEREVAARRERMHFEKAEQTLAETVERLTKSKEKQLDILEKESEEHMKKTELYYRGLKESAEAKTVELSARIAELERRVYHAETEAKRAKAKAEASETPAKLAEAKAECEEKKRIRAERKVQHLDFLEKSIKTCEEKREVAEKNLERAIQQFEVVAAENAELKSALFLRERTTASGVVLGRSASARTPGTTRVAAA